MLQNIKTTALFIIITASSLAIKASSKESISVDQKDIVKALEAENLAKTAEKNICTEIGLNPAWGLGGIEPRKPYNFYSPFRDHNILKEQGYQDTYELEWDALHGALPEAEKKKFRFTAIDVARLLFSVGGRDAVKNYQERQRKRIEAHNQSINEKIIADGRTKSFIQKWERFGNLLLDGLRNLQKRKKEVQTLLLYIQLSLCFAFLSYFLAKYGIPYLLKYLFDTKPVIIKEKHLSWRFWHAKPLPSRMEELHYNDTVNTWLAKAVNNDKKKIAHNLKTKKGKEKFHFNYILLKGPSGTGKTVLAKEYAKEAGFDFIHVGGSAWSQLEEPDALTNFNDTLRLARNNPRPVLFFIDEIDVVFPKRVKSIGVSRKLTSSFLENIEKPYHAHIKFIFATNLTQEIDIAVRSRVAKEIPINKPNEHQAQKIYQTYMTKFAHQHDLTFEDINEPLAGLTGRDLEVICNEAAENAKLAGQEKILQKDILDLIRIKKQKELSVDNKQKPLTTAPEEHKQTDYPWWLLPLLIILSLLAATGFFLYKRSKQPNPLNQII